MIKNLKSDSELFLNLPLGAVSFQQQRFANGGVYKTPYQRQFIDDMEMILLSHRQIIAKFIKGHIEGNFIATQWIFLYDNFFTKKGEVNSKICDIDNGKKLAQDIIFKSLGLDDKIIAFSSDLRWQAPEDAIILKLISISKDEINKNILEFYNSTIA